MDAFYKVLSVRNFVTRHVATNHIVVMPVGNAKAIGHNGSIAPCQQCWTREATARDDMVIDDSGGRMCVEVM